MVCTANGVCVITHLRLGRARSAVSFVIVSVAQTNLTSHLHLFNLNMNAAVRALKEYIRLGLNIVCVFETTVCLAVHSAAHDGTF
jgi:hypothetical protein